MRIGILSNVFESTLANTEVEQDLTSVGRAIEAALATTGHETIFYDVNEETFDRISKDNLDAVFNVCERYNGRSVLEPNVASMLELLRIPYTGSSPWALALCMNKIRVHEILSHHGLPIPKHQIFTSSRQKLSADLSYPVIVKPSAMDNSIGITTKSVVHNDDELQEQVANLLGAYGQACIVEEFLPGREFTIGVIGNEKPFTLPVCEVSFEGIPEGTPAILSYEAKWYRNSEEYQGTPIICPAKIPVELELTMCQLALRAFTLLGVRDYGRVDFRLDAEGNPHILEMNPNPGMNPEDFIPIAAQAAGISYPKLINRILKETVARNDIKPTGNGHSPKEQHEKEHNGNSRRE